LLYHPVGNNGCFTECKSKRSVVCCVTAQGAGVWPLARRSARCWLFGVGGICSCSGVEKQGASFSGKVAHRTARPQSSQRLPIDSPPGHRVPSWPQIHRYPAAAEEQAGRRLQPPLQQIVPPVQWKLNGCMAEGMDGRAAGHAVLTHLCACEAAGVTPNDASLRVLHSAVILIPMSHSLSATAQCQTVLWQAERLLYKFTAALAGCLLLLPQQHSPTFVLIQYLWCEGTHRPRNKHLPPLFPFSTASDTRILRTADILTTVGRGHEGVGGPACCAEQLKQTWAEKSWRASEGSASSTSTAATITGYATSRFPVFASISR
ncbi:hypothetical protein XENORESO_011920, partial [Xenotaenia resolanae]